LRLRVPTSHRSSLVGIMVVTDFGSVYSVSLKTGDLLPAVSILSRAPHTHILWLNLLWQHDFQSEVND